LKFLVVGDIHFKGVNPVARMDNYQEALTEKIHQVYSMAEKYKTQAIIQTGDIFDSPATSWGTVADLADILKAAPCPVLTIPGNHDLWAGNPESERRTPFGFLSRLNLFWNLAESPYECGYEYVDKERSATYITGHGFNMDTDTKAGNGQYKPQHKPQPNDYTFGGVSIHVVHSMLLTEPPYFEMRHTLIKDVQTTAKVIITGHYHTGFGIVYREDDVLFINPGALCRLTAHPEEMRRQVRVALLTIEDGQAYAELIPLDVKPGSEVLSREHLETAAERQERINRFLFLLTAEGESKFLEVRDIVTDIARREMLPEAVAKEALVRIARVREELGRTW